MQPGKATSRPSSSRPGIRLKLPALDMRPRCINAQRDEVAGSSKRGRWTAFTPRATSWTQWRPSGSACTRPEVGTSPKRARDFRDAERFKVAVHFDGVGLYLAPEAPMPQTRPTHARPPKRSRAVAQPRPRRPVLKMLSMTQGGVSEVSGVG